MERTPYVDELFWTNQTKGDGTPNTNTAIVDQPKRGNSYRQHIATTRKVLTRPSVCNNSKKK